MTTFLTWRKKDPAPGSSTTGTVTSEKPKNGVLDAVMRVGEFFSEWHLVAQPHTSLSLQFGAKSRPPRCAATRA
jgi:hypothetical protein